MCTDLRLLNPKKFNISARNLDFPMVMSTQVSFVPAGTAFESIAPLGEQAVSWSAKYDYVGMLSVPAKQEASMKFLPAKYWCINVDAFNVKGLSAAALWNSDSTYPAASGKAPGTQFLAEFNLVDWIAGNFATVDEVRAAFTGSAMPAVWDVQFDVLGFSFRLLPCHFVVHDAHGKDLVIEFIDGQVVLAEPVCGVLANEPRLSWHVQNLSNYVNLTYNDVTSADFGGVKINALGNNTGMLGLPGDFTSPSRYVRTVLLNRSSATATDLDTPEKAIAHASHLIDSPAPPYHINSSNDFTQWQVIRDHNALKYYIRTYFGIGTQLIDLNLINFKTLGGAKYPMLQNTFETIPLTP